MHLAQITGVTSPSTVFTDFNTLPSTAVGRVLLFAIYISGFIFLFRLLTSGFTFLSSSGDPAKIQSATKGLTTGVIGLVVVIAAFFIAQIIQTVFGLNLL